MPILVPGPASPQLSQRLSEISGLSEVKVSYRVFPDGESYIRLEEPLKGDVAVVVQSCPPPQDKRLIELLQLVDASRRAGASKVIAVAPYLAYSRQDKVFLNYEALSSEIVANVLCAMGVRAFVTVNVHSEAVLKYFKVKAVNVDAFSEIASYIKSLDLKDPVVLSPDRKRHPEAVRVAQRLGCESAFLDKRRDPLTGSVVTEEKALDVMGRDVIIVDDIISTGGTIINAARIVSKNKPKRIMAACVHGLYAANAVEKLLAAGISELISTDTIESGTSKVSVAGALSSSLRQVMEDLL
ncbi:MAG: ribose-phosphate diphosphokinase [Candidatus Nezhaarchaeota archaeon]|nr:ribose-phosphate diphosphokinase [Candidatus Nezhaarchaeota archaeon]